MARTKAAHQSTGGGAAINKQNAPIRAPRTQHARRLQTEAAILASAETLFVQQGYYRTSVDEIASRAGLTKGAVYVHFKDKQEVLLVLLQRAEDQVLRPILTSMDNPNIDPVQKLVNYAHSWARVAIEQRNTMFLPILMSFEFLETNEQIKQTISNMYERTYGALSAVIEEGRKAGLIAVEGSGREQAAVLIGVMDGLLLEWLRRGEMLDGERMSRVARQMILSGLVQRSP